MAGGGVEVIAGGRVEQVAGPPGDGGGVGDEVRHAALARSDGQIEGEAIAVESGAPAVERHHAAPLDERRTAEVAAVREVPERGRDHQRPRASWRWRKQSTVWSFTIPVACMNA